MKISMWQWKGNPVAWYTYYKNMVAWTGNTNHFMDGPTIEVEDSDTPIADILVDANFENKSVLLTFTDDKYVNEFWDAMQKETDECKYFPNILTALQKREPYNWGIFAGSSVICKVLSTFANKIGKLTLVSGCTYQEEYACTVFCNGAYSLDIDRDTLTFIKSKIQ